MLTVFGTDTHTNGADGNYKYFNWYDNGLNASIGILAQQWTNHNGPTFIKASIRPTLSWHAPKPCLVLLRI